MSGVSLQLALLAPPAVAVALARVFPSLFFPLAPKCSSDSSEMLQHCQNMSQRFIGVSVAATGLVWLFASIVTSLVGPQSVVERLAFAMKLECAPLLLYVFTILRVAIRRGSDEKAVMGQRTGGSASTEIAIRILNNTTEQLVLALPSHLILSLLLPQENFAVLVGVVSLWLSGRLLFVMGYTAEHPMGREVGFQLTFIPTVIVVLYNVTFGLLFA
jgi:uncharacterized membrane protein YecN with MAPEG domain